MNTTDVLDRFTKGLAGRYTIKRELGRGAMGIVYLAWDDKHSRMVAIKVLSGEASAAIGRARFLREINIAASLNHPHILPLYDSDATDDALYFVMPFVDGESLRDRLSREKQLPVAQATRLAKEVADALGYAHARGVIHRDIKPANILLESNHAVVADFGLASMTGTLSADRLTDTGISIGTPLYMSPEQALAQRVDERSDIYSLGCLFYEMLAGDPPFTGTTPQSILAKKLFEPLPSIRIVRDTVPPAIEQVLLKTVTKNPADRFQTALQFTEALEAAEFDQSHPPISHPRAAAVEPEDDDDPFDSDFLSDQPRGRRFSLARLAGMAVGSLVLLTLIGFLTTVVYDVKMQLPIEFTPSRVDFPVIGARALIPVLSIAFVVVIVLLIMKYVFRVLLYGIRKMPVTESSMTTPRKWVERWDRLRRNANPETVGELYLIGSILISVLVVARFSDLFAALAGNESDMLSSACRDVHNSYLINLSVLITVLVVLWRRLPRYMRVRRASRMSIARVRWGGLLWIVVLVLIETAPWRVLWSNERPAVVIDGERAYILAERSRDLVIYNADRRITQTYRGETPPGLQRENKAGYVFEGSGSCQQPTDSR